jgi:PAS domain S-box-containing protein
MRFIRNLRYIILAILLVSSMFSWADTDNLLKGLKNATGSKKIEILLKLAKEVQDYKFQEAIEYGNDALELAREINSEKHEVEALLSLSNSYNRCGDYTKSKNLGIDALSLANKLQDNLLISKTLTSNIYNSIVFNDFRYAFKASSQLLKINYMKKNEFEGTSYKYIGDIFQKIGNGEKAIEYHLMALEFHLKNTDLEYHIFNSNFEYRYQITTSLGGDYRHQGNLHKSLEYYFMLLEFTPKEDTYKFGRALNHIGNIYIRLENYEKALDYCEQALQYYNIENKLYKMGNIYNDMARIYFMTGNHQKAFEYNLLSLRNREALNNTILVASSYRNIADNYLDTKDYSKSEDYYLKSLTEAEKINDLSIPQYVHEKMARMYDEMKMDGPALKSYKKYLELYKTTQNKELQTKMLNEQFNLEITTIEQENSLLRKSNTNLNQEVRISEKIRFTLMYILAIVVLILVFSLFIYYDKKKYSRRLEREVEAKTKDLDNSRMVLKNIDTEKEMLASEMMNLRFTYENLVQNLGEGIGILSTEDEFLAVNPSTEKIFGIKSKDLVGRNLKEFIISEKLNLEQDKALQNINSNVSTYEITIKRPIGGKRNIIITATPIKSNEGKVISILSTFRDITERINDENKIKEMLRKNIELLQELEHRVKNNLQLIYSIAGMMTNSTKDKKLRTRLKQFESSIYVISLINDVLLLDDKHYIDFQIYINNIFSNLSMTMSDYSEKVKFENDTIIKEININYAVPLGMIINELISNSLIHAFSEDRINTITLKYRKINNENILEYSDNGIGMSKSIDISKCKSFGLKMIYLQSRQLRGKLEITTSKGFYLKLTFHDLALSTFSRV